MPNARTEVFLAREFLEVRRRQASKSGNSISGRGNNPDKNKHTSSFHVRCPVQFQTTKKQNEASESIGEVKHLGVKTPRASSLSSSLSLKIIYLFKGRVSERGTFLSTVSLPK